MSPRVDAIVVGASSGAVEAIGTLLSRLPGNYSIPMIIVVHLPPDRPAALVDVLRSKGLMQVCEAEDKEPIRKNTVYVAPPDYHLIVEKDKRLSLFFDEAVNYSRPAIDVLFETAADAYAEALLGIILTGANDDGSQGLRCIIDAGGRGIVQSPESALAPTMPEAALARSSTAQAMDLEQMTNYLLQLDHGYD